MKNAVLLSGDPALVQVVEEALVRPAWTLLLAADTTRAMASLKTRSVDVMLVDLGSSETSAMQIPLTASRMFPDICLVLMAPSAAADAARLTYGANVARFVRMPEELPGLAGIVDGACQKRRSNATSLMEERPNVLFSAIKAIASTIDAKSYFTAEHSSRVTELCLLAAKALGLSQADMCLLELAAQIHDIGKIGTADEILDKSGPLTEVEWVDILRHPDLGSSMLSHIPVLLHVASVVRHHHERYDGNGYPDGLSGEAIPKLARLIAIADAYEAMTSTRPYRPAKTHAEAVQELQAGAGAQFDPGMLDYFIAAVDDAEAGRKAA